MTSFEISKNPLTLITETNKFNGTNYNDWLRNHRIVLDFENQGYILDKPLPTALPEGSSPEERLTIEKLHEDNHKVCSIILASLTNEIQKQYDMLEDVPSIMLRMKEVYKRKLRSDGKATTFKARLVAKGYTQRPVVDFEETYSSVAMAKSIRILLAIAAWYDYKI
ncbi:UNVERIFIED_CONTAM: hypothetical protein Slati_2216600 [Sesamum latifolium]|uniref:Reverse transcriptase Ty1/copia-type domain-containing protein n=1 Tax=Sesamum latifolium TaxID=2727402 RepID=A0AAW2WT19_9LAMI